MNPYERRESFELIVWSTCHRYWSVLPGETAVKLKPFPGAFGNGTNLVIRLAAIELRSAAPILPKFAFEHPTILPVVSFVAVPQLKIAPVFVPLAENHGVPAPWTVPSSPVKVNGVEPAPALAMVTRSSLKFPPRSAAE